MPRGVGGLKDIYPNNISKRENSKNGTHTVSSLRDSPFEDNLYLKFERIVLLWTVIYPRSTICKEALLVSSCPTNVNDNCHSEIGSPYN